MTRATTVASHAIGTALVIVAARCCDRRAETLKITVTLSEDLATDRDTSVLPARDVASLMALGEKVKDAWAGCPSDVRISIQIFIVVSLATGVGLDVWQALLAGVIARLTRLLDE